MLNLGPVVRRFFNLNPPMSLVESLQCLKAELQDMVKGVKLVGTHVPYLCVMCYKHKGWAPRGFNYQLVHEHLADVLWDPDHNQPMVVERFVSNLAQVRWTDLSEAERSLVKAYTERDAFVLRIAFLEYLILLEQQK